MGPICTRKGSVRVRSIMRNKFLAAITKADHQLSENFYFIKNIIWLTYESFSILSDAFRQKSVIFSKNSCSWVIWFYITHTHTHTKDTHHTHTDAQHTQVPVDWHTNINLCLCHFFYVLIKAALFTLIE